MDNEAVLDEHNRANLARISLLRTLTPTPEIQTYLAALEAQVVKRFVHHADGARRGEIQHAQEDASQKLAGMLTYELQLATLTNRALAGETIA